MTYEQMIDGLRAAGNWPIPRPMTADQLDAHLAESRPMIARLHNARPTSVAASDVPPRIPEAVLNAPARIKDVLTILESVSSEMAGSHNALAKRVARLEASA